LLADADIQAEGSEAESVKIDGRKFSYSYQSGMGLCEENAKRSWSFTLGKKYEQLETTFGVSDEADNDTKLRFRILDEKNTELFRSKTIAIGDSDRIKVDVRGVVRLKLQTLATRSSCGFDLHSDVGAWGNPKVSWTSKE
jgi:hypothetical protein